MNIRFLSEYGFSYSDFLFGGVFLDFLFVLNSLLLGVGLSMDAFSVSLANGLNEPKMAKGKMLAVSGTYAFFQALMPLTGWLCVHTVVEKFKSFEKFVPWIALVLLCYIGGKMLIEGIKKELEAETVKKLTPAVLFVQGVATSIDALSVGFAFAEYNFITALTASLLIAAVAFVLCTGGLCIGKKAGMKLADKATIVGGIILIAIGIEIFLSNIL